MPFAHHALLNSLSAKLKKKIKHKLQELQELN